MEPLRVIAAPQRLRILELVWSAISQHLTVLKSAGFVTERREGRRRFYRADHAALGWLRQVVEDHWRQRLNRLKDLAEAEQRMKESL